MAKDLKLRAVMDAKSVHTEIGKIISDIERMAKAQASGADRAAQVSERAANKAIASEEKAAKERIRIQRNSAALADRQEKEAANRAARANQNSLQQSRDMAEATLKVERKAALAEASVVVDRFDRRMSIERVRHAQSLADLKGNQKAIEAETKRFNAVIARIQMDQASFPQTPFQKLLGHLTNVTGQMGVRLPAAAQSAAVSLGAEGGGLAAAAGLATAGIAGLMAVMIPAYKAARSQDDANKKLAAVLRATGGAAGLTFEELDKMAGGLQKVTDFEDDTVMGAQAMLLRFDAIGRDVFPQALKAATDLAAGTGNLEGAAESLGQALQKPEEAYRKLKAMQVVLSEAQKKQIELFVESGEKGRAQQVILDAVAKSYSGNAAAMSHSTVRLKHHIGDLMEAMGGPLVKVIDRVAESLLSVGKADSEAFEAKRLSGGFANYGESALKAAGQVETFQKTLEESFRKRNPSQNKAEKKPLDEDQKQQLKELQDELARVKLDSIQDTTAKAIAIENLEYQKRIEKMRGFAEAREEAAKIHAQKIFQINQEASEKFMADQAQANNDARAADREAKEKRLSEKLKAENEANRRIIEQDQQTDALRSQYADMRIAANENIAEREKEASEKKFDDMRIAYAGNAQALTVIDEMQSAERLRIAKAEQDSKKQMMIGFVGSIGNLLSVLGKKNRALAKAGQVVQIGEGIANTALGVTKALSAAAPPWNFIMAGTVAAAGAAQVATIANQKYATGTDFAPGGMALVGERGPELIHLPRGSRVDTASQTRQGMGFTHNGNVIVSVAMPSGTSDMQAKRLGASVAVGYMDELKAHRKRERDAEYYLGARK